MLLVQSKKAEHWNMNDFSVGMYHTNLSITKNNLI